MKLPPHLPGPFEQHLRDRSRTHHKLGIKHFSTPISPFSPKLLRLLLPKYQVFTAPPRCFLRYSFWLPRRDISSIHGFPLPHHHLGNPLRRQVTLLSYTGDMKGRTSHQSATHRSGKLGSPVSLEGLKWIYIIYSAQLVAINGQRIHLGSQLHVLRHLRVTGAYR